MSGFAVSPRRQKQDPMLWAADLVAWAWARCGDYRAGIEPLVAAHIRV